MCSLCSVLFLMISLQSDFVDANIRVLKICTLIRWILYRYEICGKETLKCENIQQGEITSLNIMYRFSFPFRYQNFGTLASSPGGVLLQIAGFAATTSKLD